MTVLGTRAAAVPRMARMANPRTPADISGCTVFLRSDAGVERDASGNALSWKEYTGRGNTASQSTAGARPLISAVNGRPVLQTTKAARFISFANTVDLDPSTTLGFTLYVAFRTSATGTADYIAGRWISGGPGTPNQSWIVGVNDGANTTPGMYLSEAGTLAQINRKGSPDASTGATTVLGLRYNPATGLLYCRSGATESGGSAIAAPTVGTQLSHIGRLFSGDTILGIDADIFAFIGYRRSVTAPEDVFIRNWLRENTGAV